MSERGLSLDAGDGGAAAIVAGLLLVALVVVVYFFYFGLGSMQQPRIDIDVPPAAVNTAQR
jgi:hypothetical protein